MDVLDASIIDLGERFGALVSSDDNYLSHGGGVSAALWDAAGPALQAHVREKRPKLRLGDVYASPAGDLDADVLLHAVTIDFDRNTSVGPREARELFSDVLDAASQRQCDSIALPLLGSGAGGLDQEAAIAAAADAIRGHLLGFSRLRRIALLALGSSFEPCQAAIAEALRSCIDLPDRLRYAEQVFPTKNAEFLRRGLAAMEDVATPWKFQVATTMLLSATIRGTTRVGLDRATRSLQGGELDPHQIETCEWLALSPHRSVVPRAHLVGSHIAAGEIDDPLRQVTLEHVLRILNSLLVLLRHPLAGRIAGALVAGTQARQELVHQSDGKDEAWLVGRSRTVMRGVDAALALLAAGWAPLHACAEEPTPRHPVAAGPGVIAPPTTPRQATKPAIASTGAPEIAANKARSYTEHVRKLYGFILESLDPQVLQDLCEELERKGYRGTHEMCLLESCVSMEDPAAFLADQFNARELKDHLRRVTGRQAPAGATSRDLAVLLLDFFGFPRAAHPVGLASVIAALRKGRARVPVSSIVELQGIVTQAASRLEYAVQVLLRFVCRVAFGEAPEPFFRHKDPDGKLPPLDKCSLGRLLELLETLAKELEAGQGPGIEAFGQDFRTRRLSPDGANGIAALRNQFAHFQKKEEALSVEEARLRARQFFDDALAFLEYLGAEETRVFPRIITIERIQIDRWGRLTIEATDDEGMPEHLFTDRRVEPGQVYYMHPLTNPLRVDPILVEAGELTAPKVDTRPKD